MKPVRILKPALVKYIILPSIHTASVMDLSHKGVHWRTHEHDTEVAQKQMPTTRNIVTQHDMANRFPGKSRIYGSMMETFDRDNQIVYMETLE
jgi:hypothetical protein